MKLTTILLFMLLAMELFAQTKITGHVFRDSEPLIGANIILKHSKKGTISDFDGNFEMRVTPKDTLIISYLGLDSKAIVIDKQKHLNISLDGNIALEEVIVVAYGNYNCRTICCGIVGRCIHVLNNPEFLTEKLYPNPSKTGQFQLKLIDDYKNISFKVYNITGQLMKAFKAKPYNQILNMDLSEFSSGMYIVNIYADGKQIASKKAIID